MKEKRVRIFLLHRRVLAVLCTLAVAAGIFYVTLYPASRTAAATQRQLPIYSVERKDKLCSISFDAAWGDGKVRQSRGQTVFVQLGGAVGIQAGYVAGGDGAAELLLQGVDLGGAFLQHVGGAVADGHHGHIGVHGEDIQRLSFRRAAGGEG